MEIVLGILVASLLLVAAERLWQQGQQPSRWRDALRQQYAYACQVELAAFRARR